MTSLIARPLQEIARVTHHNTTPHGLFFAHHYKTYNWLSQIELLLGGIKTCKIKTVECRSRCMTKCNINFLKFPLLVHTHVKFVN